MPRLTDAGGWAALKPAGEHRDYDAGAGLRQ